jgi:hypothetical protein
MLRLHFVPAQHDNCMVLLGALKLLHETRLGRQKFPLFMNLGFHLGGQYPRPQSQNGRGSGMKSEQVLAATFPHDH